MKRTILSGPDFYAVVEDGLLTEYLRKEKDTQCGDILLGTVERIMPGTGSAFVDIGRKRSGFLPLSENSSSFTGDKLSSGMKIVIQIRKEEIKEKGAFLTRDLTIPGKNILLMPLNRHIGVSARIKDDEKREKMLSTGKEIAGGSFGLVMRSSSLEAEKTDISEEVDSLKKEWEAIRNKIRQGGRNGTILYHADPARQMLDDYAGQGPAEIIETAALNDDLQRQLNGSRERKVRLENGGNIVIDQCEAMTVIDVNSGASTGKGALMSSYADTNLSACETIAAQIRLRNLSGIILIDFIDMKPEEDRKKVMDKLQLFISRDRRKTVIHGWTKLGILEMTRKRTV